ncbi:Pre-mRNA-splicing factor sap61 [Cyberlindnera fabianii]|uniref:Pre-mRNA-splicing factor sap61 n=1 Tax=Cyberlindnera fabianii TaxID=36022 RepID=A0A1V2L0J7_CYBFA|nr:Pre-mRNA-splicing factor sap61 [Cyberlindnera fabianii]
MSLEHQRAALEELHVIERALTDRIIHMSFITLMMINLLLKGKKRSFREILLQQHEMERFIDNYKRQKVSLDTVRNSTGQDDLKELQDKTFELQKFDQLFNKLKQKDSDGVVNGLQHIYSLKSSSGINILSEVGADIDLSSMFSGEEYFGKYIDLISLHEQWLNLSIDKFNYVKYLEIFDKFDQQRLKKGDDYIKYLEDLSNYLMGYIKRTKPLFDLAKHIDQIKSDFSEIQESNSLFCESCNKNFAKQTVYDAHLTGKKHLKNVQRAHTTQQKTNYKFIEYQITQLNVKNQSLTQREKALTERERLIELDQLAKDEQLSDSDDEQQHEENTDYNSLYNPMNLPLGPDGHPIPHWLYKLHGLDIEYTCEICSNFSYQGRRAFDKHFLESKHIHGLKCLGITKPTLFKNITKIEEAQNLWQKIRKDEKIRESEKENAVEVEDEQGNVMSEKVYNDLKKQGLL